MKRYNLVLLCVLFVLLCAAHKSVGAEDLIGAPPTADQKALDDATAKAAATKLPPAVQSLIDRADAAAVKIQAKAKDDEGKLRADLVASLAKAQAEATKKGDLSLALAIKARIDEQGKMVPGVTEKPKAEVKSEPFNGAFSYSFPNGHTGYIDVQRPSVVDRLSATRGTVTQEGATWVVTWSNQTRWMVRERRGEFAAESSDGMCTLGKVAP